MNRTEAIDLMRAERHRHAMSGLDDGTAHCRCGGWSGQNYESFYRHEEESILIALLAAGFLLQPETEGEPCA